MPIYEYHCEKCGEFEVTQRITDTPLKRCPTCKSRVKKLISNTSFQLKGSGWYQTDYGSKKSPDKSLEKGAAKIDATSDTKSDSKSDSKADAPAASGETSSKEKSSGKKGGASAKAA